MLHHLRTWPRVRSTKSSVQGGPSQERIFGEKRAMRLWFANFIMYSAALTEAGCYVPFTDIGSAVMKMLADTHGQMIGNDLNDVADQLIARHRGRS